MRKYLVTAVVFLGSMSAGFSAAQDVESEPAQKFVLRIDNMNHEVQMNAAHEIVIAGKAHRVRVELSPTRRFEKVGLSFDFDAKRHFSYEALSRFVDHWALDGNNTTIIVQNYKVKVANSEIIDSFKDQYQEMKAETNWSKTSLNYGADTISGERLLINMGNIKLEQQIFFFNKKNESRIVILQDAINDDNSNTEEFVKMRSLFQESLSVTL